MTPRTAAPDALRDYGDNEPYTFGQAVYLLRRVEKATQHDYGFHDLHAAIVEWLARLAASPIHSEPGRDLPEQADALRGLDGSAPSTAPAVPAAIDVERLARALAHYKPDKSWMQRHNSWSRPDPTDAAAIAAAYEREK